MRFGAAAIALGRFAIRIQSNRQPRRHLPARAAYRATKLCTTPGPPIPGAHRRRWILLAEELCEPPAELVVAVELHSNTPRLEGPHGRSRRATT